MQRSGIAEIAPSSHSPTCKVNRRHLPRWVIDAIRLCALVKKKNYETETAVIDGLPLSGKAAGSKRPLRNNRRPCDTTAACGWVGGREGTSLG
jgi:hypothetical protein